jgi:hypothetical protein
MKPHIWWSPVDRWWVCAMGDAFGHGITPLEAYDWWIKSYHSIYGYPPGRIVSHH